MHDTNAMTTTADNTLKEEKHVDMNVSDPLAPTHRPMDDSNPVSQIDYQRLGTIEAGKASGSLATLDHWLSKLFAQCLLETTDIKKEEKERLRLLQETVIERKEEVEQLQARRTNLLSSRSDFAKKSEALQTEINKIKAGDASMHPAENEKQVNLPTLIVNLVILIGVTAYLLLFYASIIYGAFITSTSQFIDQLDGSDKLMFPTIMNLNVFAEAWAMNSVTGITFLLAASCVFLGLGFLTHQFNKEKKWTAKYPLLAFTFILDMLMAYQIVRVIHEAKQLTGVTDEPWRTAMILENIDFYIILGAGFAIYIIWGYLWGYFMQELSLLSPRRVSIRERKGQIATLQIESLDALHALDELEVLLAGKRSEIKKIEISREVTVHDPKIIQERLYSFTIGWSNFSKLMDHPASSSESSIRQALSDFMQRNNIQETRLEAL